MFHVIDGGDFQKKGKFKFEIALGTSVQAVYTNGARIVLRDANDKPIIWKTIAVPGP